MLRSQLSIARKFLLDMSQPLQITSKSRLDAGSLRALQNKYATESALFSSQLEGVPSGPTSPAPAVAIAPARTSPEKGTAAPKATARPDPALLAGAAQATVNTTVASDAPLAAVVGGDEDGIAVAAAEPPDAVVG